MLPIPGASTGGTTYTIEEHQEKAGPSIMLIKCPEEGQWRGLEIPPPERDPLAWCRQQSLLHHSAFFVMLHLIRHPVSSSFLPREGRKADVHEECLAH